jgi:mannitol-1-/sugar-/sorbitol-6-/2-deoxyglucose-6-phosphatase
VLEAAIFDMDGVLVDSEPIWQDVETELLGRLGVPLTKELCRQTMGFRVNEAVAFWYERHPWTGPSVDEVADQLVEGVIAAIGARGEPMAGVEDAIAFLRGRGLRLAIASSSYYRVIDAVLERCGLADAFEVVHSAQDEPVGKPDPAVYLTAAAKLGVAPSACVALEDSPNGVVSATRAGMTCIAIPEPGTEDDPRFGDAAVVLSSLADLAERWATVAAL